MFDFHKNKKRYFEIQYKTAINSIIPFLSETSFENKKVLEVGCGEAGILKAFAEKKAECLGVELNNNRVILAKEFLKSEKFCHKIRFISDDIYNQFSSSEYKDFFDIIILKDVIEHIPNQQQLLILLEKIIKPSGKIFIAFPDWFSPFAGHQQMVRNKFFSRLPFYHLLPRPIYKSILKLAGQKPHIINELLEIKTSGISMRKFEIFAKKSNLKTWRKKTYFVPPIYKFKFGLHERESPVFFSSIPFVKEFFGLSCYYILTK